MLRQGPLYIVIRPLELGVTKREDSRALEERCEARPLCNPGFERCELSPKVLRAGARPVTYRRLGSGEVARAAEPTVKRDRVAVIVVGAGEVAEPEREVVRPRL